MSSLRTHIHMTSSVMCCVLIKPLEILLCIKQYASLSMFDIKHCLSGFADKIEIADKND